MTTAAPHPLVAIVTPVYNGAEFLAETMESVQAQTYPNLVHVVLDNASTDATPDIIASFRNRKIPVIVGRNPSTVPMDDNWNEALKLIPAEAAYFSVVCADDVLMPQSTARLAMLGESDPAITVLSGAVLRNGQKDLNGWPAHRDVFDGSEATRLLFTNGGQLDCRQMMLRRSALESATPFFDAAVTYSSDMDAALRLLRAGKLGFVHEPLMQVRDHAETETAKIVFPNQMHFFAWLMLLHRYGPAAFGETAYRPLHRKYRRFYLRRMLTWLVRGNRKAVELHFGELRKLGAPPRLWEFADALANWAFLRLSGRPGWLGYPS